MSTIRGEVHLQDFYVEIKRIRETADTRSVQSFIDDVRQAVEQIPSRLAISLDILPEHCDQITDRLGPAAPAAAAFCQQAVAEAAQNLGPNETRVIGIPGLADGEVTLRIRDVPGKDATSPTAYVSGIMPVAYTQNEWRKFGDHVSSCLGQLRPGRANVLGVKIDSTPHDPFDLRAALQHLGENLARGDDEFFRGKRFPGGCTEFKERSRLLSAVVVKSMWATLGENDARNAVWCNPDAAIPLVDGVIDHLASMR